MSEASVRSKAQRSLQTLRGERYEVIEQLGKGGMATVFRCNDAKLNRPVAIKILHQHLIGEPRHHSRFLREAESIARLDHPGIVDIYDILEIEAEFLAIVMEYIDGPSLAEIIESSAPIPPELAATTLVPVLDALHTAHEQGIIHRDIKPGNILLDTTGKSRLTDFGIAHVADDSVLTKPGSLIGSPAFMSPEMAESNPVDRRADIFSMGIVVYLMVTGETPFAGKTAPTVLRNIADGRCERADLVRGAVGRHFADILGELMETDPNDRLDSARLVSARFTEFLEQTMGDDRPDIKRWISNPKAYPSALESELSEQILQRAKDAIERGDHHQALPLLERRIAIDPADRHATALLHRLHDDPRWWSAKLVAVTATLLLAAVAVGYISLGNTDDTESAMDETATDPESEYPLQVESRSLHPTAHDGIRWASLAGHHTGDETKDIAISTTLAIAEGRGEETNSPANPDERLEPADETLPDGAAQQAVEDTKHVQFRVIPASATLAIGDIELDAMQAARGAELPHGVHRLIARGPGAKSYQQRLIVGPETSGDQTIVLYWKDGYIRLVVDRDALVWIDDDTGPTSVDAGDDHLLAIPFGRADRVSNEREVELRIAARDDLQRSTRKTVRVRPETETPIAVTLHEER